MHQICSFRQTDTAHETSQEPGWKRFFPSAGNFLTVCRFRVVNAEKFYKCFCENQLCVNLFVKKNCELIVDIFNDNG